MKKIEEIRRFINDSCNLILSDNKEDWLKIKNKMITGTDVPAFYYIDKYKELYDVCNRLIHGVEVPFEHSDKVETGKILEPYLLERLERWITKKGISDYEIIDNQENVLLQDRDLSYIGGTPDGFVGIEDKKYIVEIKTTGLFKDAYDNLKEKALYQSAYYSAISKLDGVVRVVFQLPFGFNHARFIENKNTEIFEYLQAPEIEVIPIERHLQNQIIEDAIAIYTNYVEKGILPEITRYETVKRCLKDTQGIVDATEIIADNVLKYKAVKERISKLSDLQDELQAKITVFMNEASILKHDDKIIATHKANKNGIRTFREK